jgi:hypothetical protein
MNFSYISIGKGNGEKKPQGKSLGKNDVKQISREKCQRRPMAAAQKKHVAKANAPQKTNARVDRSMRALENLEAQQSDAK